jgi:hypothetical protein
MYQELAQINVPKHDYKPIEEAHTIKTSKETV